MRMPPDSASIGTVRPGNAASSTRAGRATTRLALLAATAAVAAGCASHVVRLEPVPAVDGRCGDEPGICLLGVPTPLEDGGETLAWQCLGLDGGATAACALPSPASPPPASPEAGQTRPITTPPGVTDTVGVAPEPGTAAGTQGAATPRPAAVTQRTQTQIAELLAAKARRTPAQRKVGSELLERAAAETLGASGVSLPEDRLPAPDAAADALQAEDGRVLVDIRAEVAPAVLARIRELGGAVVNSVPR